MVAEALRRLRSEAQWPTVLSWRPSRFLRPRRGARKYVVSHGCMITRNLISVDQRSSRNPAALYPSRKIEFVHLPLLLGGEGERVHGSGARLRFAGRSAPGELQAPLERAERRGAARPGAQRDEPRAEPEKHPLQAGVAGRPALWRPTVAWSQEA